MPTDDGEHASGDPCFELAERWPHGKRAIDMSGGLLEPPHGHQYEGKSRMCPGRKQRQMLLLWSEPAERVLGGWQVPVASYAIPMARNAVAVQPRRPTAPRSTRRSQRRVWPPRSARVR